jgi:hypothetical protein
VSRRQHRERSIFDPRHLQATDVVEVPDPLTIFPDRDREQFYRNLFEPDDSFVVLCAPNDTHNCCCAPSRRTAL